MASKWDVDFDDYEEKEGAVYDGDPPKPGLYEAKLVQYSDHEGGSTDTSMKWVFEITAEPFAGWRGWVYSDLEKAKWKTQQIVKAIQGGSEKPMSLNPDRAEAIVKKAKAVKVRVKKDTYEGEYRPKISVVLPLEGGGTKKKGTTEDPWASSDDDD